MSAGQVYEFPRERGRMMGGSAQAIAEADEQVARLKRALRWQAKGYAVHNALGDERPCPCPECSNVDECLEEASR